MRRLRNVKIVATLGPASSDYKMIRALHEAGADVFRLNMSHGTHEDQKARYDIIRQVEADTGRPIGVLADLQGPKLRVGTFKNGTEDLVEGAKFRFDLDPAEGTVERVCLPHKEIFAALEPGSSLLVNDGKIRLKVDDCGPDFANCTVTTSGTYRIYPLEVATPDGGMQALKVARNDTQSRDYWLEFRQLFTSNPSLMNGASFNFGFPSSGTQCPTNPPTGCGSHLLDMTPGGNTSNSPLVIGRTFSDWPANVHFTPIGKGGTTPESLDVVVNFGPYPSNLAPTVSVSASMMTVPSNTAVTFTATAADPNGDPLAYAWDFDDGTFSINNQPMQTKTLTGNRVHQIRCTVSDMKGGTVTRNQLITVGSAATFTISGRVTLLGQGLQDVVITANNANGVITDADGYFTIAGLTANTYTLTPLLYGYSFGELFNNSITVGPSFFLIPPSEKLLSISARSASSV